MTSPDGQIVFKFEPVDQPHCETSLRMAAGGSTSTRRSCRGYTNTGSVAPSVR